MKLSFTAIRWKNFLSTGNYFNEIPLNTPGVTLVTGANGCGKSTFLDAICFALYGKAYRNINKNQLINNLNNKDLLVEIEFYANNKNYLIRRGMKPSVFEVWEDGKLQDQKPDSREQQADFENEILRMTYMSFKQIVVLSSTNFVPFLELSALDRRKIVEDLIQLKVIGVMLALAKQQRSMSSAKFEANKLQLSVSSESLNSLRELSKQTQQNLEEMVEIKRQSLASTEKALESIQLDLGINQQKIQDILDKVAKIHRKEHLNADIMQVRNMSTVVQTKLEEIAKNLKFFHENDSCPMCTQAIELELKTAQIQSLQERQAKAGDITEGLKMQAAALAGRFDENKQLNDELTRYNNSNRKLNEGIRAYKASLERITNEIKDLESRSVQFDTSLLLETEAKIVELEKEKILIEDELTYHEIEIKLLEDDGIKADIVRHYIPIINSAIEHYLNLLDFPVGFRLTENFEGFVASPTQDDFSYASFSEGEKGRIDLSLLFAWREVALHRNSINTNLLILDEVLDGSLDAAGADFLFEMFATTDSNVIVISHRESFLDKAPNHMKFEKQGHFSRIVQ